jgi:hypothetical protein
MKSPATCFITIYFSACAIFMSRADDFKIVDGFQPANANWILRDSPWLDEWRSEHLSKVPSGYDIVLVMFEKKHPGNEYWFSSYFLLKPSGKPSDEKNRYMLLHTSGTAGSILRQMKEISIEDAGNLLSEAWQEVRTAKYDSQQINISPGDNYMFYALAGEPLPGYQIGGLQMIEAINPPDKGRVQRLIDRFLEFLKDQEGNQ